jgi:hypothetical protein
MTGYVPIPPKLWSSDMLHRLYDDVCLQAVPCRIQELLHQIQELEFEAEERDECPK